MNASQPTDPYMCHRCPAERLRYGVWLDDHFCLSERDMEEMLAERGIILTDAGVLEQATNDGTLSITVPFLREPRPGCPPERRGRAPHHDAVIMDFPVLDAWDGKDSRSTVQYPHHCMNCHSTNIPEKPRT